MEKIARCWTCNTLFVEIVLINGEEKEFCSNLCVEKYELIKNFYEKIEEIFESYSEYTHIEELIIIYRGFYSAKKIRELIFELIDRGFIIKDEYGFLYPSKKKEIFLPMQNISQRFRIENFKL